MTLSTIYSSAMLSCLQLRIILRLGYNTQSNKVFLYGVPAGHITPKKVFNNVIILCRLVLSMRNNMMMLLHYNM